MFSKVGRILHQASSFPSNEWLLFRAELADAISRHLPDVQVVVATLSKAQKSTADASAGDDKRTLPVFLALLRLLRDYARYLTISESRLDVRKIIGSSGNAGLSDMAVSVALQLLAQTTDFRWQTKADGGIGPLRLLLFCCTGSSKMLSTSTLSRQMLLSWLVTSTVFEGRELAARCLVDVLQLFEGESALHVAAFVDGVIAEITSNPLAAHDEAQAYLVEILDDRQRKRTKATAPETALHPEPDIFSLLSVRKLAQNCRLADNPSLRPPLDFLRVFLSCMERNGLVEQTGVLRAALTFETNRLGAKSTSDLNSVLDSASSVISSWNDSAGPEPLSRKRRFGHRKLGTLTSLTLELVNLVPKEGISAELAFSQRCSEVDGPLAGHTAAKEPLAAQADHVFEAHSVFAANRFHEGRGSERDAGPAFRHCGCPTMWRARANQGSVAAASLCQPSKTIDPQRLQDLCGLSRSAGLRSKIRETADRVLLTADLNETLSEMFPASAQLQLRNGRLLDSKDGLPFTSDVVLSFVSSPPTDASPQTTGFFLAARAYETELEATKVDDGIADAIQKATGLVASAHNFDLGPTLEEALAQPRWISLKPMAFSALPNKIHAADGATHALADWTSVAPSLGLIGLRRQLEMVTSLLHVLPSIQTFERQPNDAARLLADSARLVLRSCETEEGDGSDALVVTLRYSRRALAAHTARILRQPLAPAARFELVKDILISRELLAEWLDSVARRVTLDWESAEVFSVLLEHIVSMEGKEVSRNFTSIAPFLGLSSFLPRFVARSRRFWIGRPHSHLFSSCWELVSWALGERIQKPRSRTCLKRSCALLETCYSSIRTMRGLLWCWKDWRPATAERLGLSIATSCAT
jgi:hypothetical protein